MKLRHVVLYILILFFPSFSFICLTYSMRLLQNLIKPLNQKFVTVRPQIIVDNLEFALIIELTFFLKIWSNNSFFILAKVNWDSQRNFPISFIPKVAIAKLIGKMQKSLATVLWKVGWTPYKVANKTQCLIWNYKLHRNLLGFLSKSQISEKIPSTFWRVFWCTHGCFC